MFEAVLFVLNISFIKVILTILSELLLCVDVTGLEGILFAGISFLCALVLCVLVPVFVFLRKIIACCRSCHYGTLCPALPLTSCDRLITRLMLMMSPYVHAQAEFNPTGFWCCSGREIIYEFLVFLAFLSTVSF